MHFPLTFKNLDNLHIYIYIMAISTSKICIFLILVLVYSISNAGIIEGGIGRRSMEMLMVEFSKMERRVVMDISREAPEGPDPQHH